MRSWAWQGYPNIQSGADYVVVLYHEGGKDGHFIATRWRLFVPATGDSMVSKSTYSLGGSEQAALQGDPGRFSSECEQGRSAEAAEVAAASAKGKAAGTGDPRGIAFHKNLRRFEFRRR